MCSKCAVSLQKLHVFIVPSAIELFSFGVAGHFRVGYFPSLGGGLPKSYPLGLALTFCCWSSGGCFSSQGVWWDGSSFGRWRFLSFFVGAYFFVRRRTPILANWHPLPSLESVVVLLHCDCWFLAGWLVFFLI